MQTHEKFRHFQTEIKHAFKIEAISWNQIQYFVCVYTENDQSQFDAEF